MTFAKDFWKAHLRALFLALAVGLIYLSHHFFIAGKLAADGKLYYPVTIAANRDEGAMYGPRANAVFKGELVPGDISIAGNEQSPSALPLLNPIILGGLGQLLGSLKAAFILSDFLFPALIFFALYLLALELIGERLHAVFFAALFMFVPKLFLAIPPFTGDLFQQFFGLWTGVFSEPLYFGRFEYPKITFLFFVLAIYFTLRALKRGGRPAILLAGVSFGLLFYTYLYDWLYFLSALVIAAAVFLFKKDYGALKRITAVTVVGFAVSIFYWLNFLELQALPHYGDVFNRLGFEIGRAVRGATAWKTYLRSSALIILLAVFWRKNFRAAAFLVGLLAAIAAGLNIQVILGFNPQPDHWHRVQFLPVALGFLVLGWLAAGKLILKRVSARYFNAALLALTAFTLLSGFWYQYFSSQINAGRYAPSKPHFESYLWLNENTPKNSVVLSFDPATNGELLLFSQNKVFLPNGFNTTISQAELWDRFTIAARVYGIGTQVFDDLIKQSGTLLYLFHDEYRDRSFDSYFRSSSRSLPEATATLMSEQYKKYLKIPTADLMKKYKLDYVYFSERERKISGNVPQAIAGLDQIYDQGGIKIYRLSL